jgi:hypothetical protein
LSGCYSVEVSGWDEDEMFFVEKSQLAGNDLTGRHISLQHKLAEGTIVFVRVLPRGLSGGVHRQCRLGFLRISSSSSAVSLFRRAISDKLGAASHPFRYNGPIRDEPRLALHP